MIISIFSKPKKKLQLFDGSIVVRGKVYKFQISLVENSPYYRYLVSLDWTSLDKHGDINPPSEEDVQISYNMSLVNLETYIVDHFKQEHKIG